MQTIYQCYLDKAPHTAHCEPTESDAIRWLELNGGGIYKNILHGFQFYVAPKRQHQ